ncbi:MAG: methionyl-tRNA formyltransferase [Desulfosporosinus sp.]|nr:methionyl-tRNA formyltransferase [Desulfosporosinus sp.]
MNEKGLYVLIEFLNKFNCSLIEYVVLSTDKNVEKDFYNELSDVCTSNNIKMYNQNDIYPIFEGYKFAVGWRWIIKDKNNLIVLHDSILPKYRGFTPLVNMLINGEEDLGVTALFASEDYDKGNIIKQETITIEYPIKVATAIEKIAHLYSKLVNEIVDLIVGNITITGTPQNNSEATYSVWRDEKDYFIDWSKSSAFIRRTVDSLGFPYTGTRTLLNGEIVIIDEVEEYSDLFIENRDVGKVILLEESYPVIICGEGLLKVKKARDLYGKSVIPLKKFRSRFGG